MTTDGVLLDTTGMFGGLRPLNQGKVRDIYDICEYLLIVSTDRLSAFDVVMPRGIPGKGKVLNEMSIMWTTRLPAARPNHFLSSTPYSYPQPFCRYPDILDGRSMLVSRLSILPIECVVRGYLAGSGWKEYQQSGMVCGINLPAGLKESDKLPVPIFTPATKVQSGHDINITHDQAAVCIASELGVSVKFAENLLPAISDRSIELYRQGAQYAFERGIIIADTKFELGYRHSLADLILADEIITPDSSRFWPLDDYEPGRSQKSFDKQPVRDWLESIGWDKNPPAPDLPAELVVETSRRYQDISTRLAN